MEKKRLITIIIIIFLFIIGIIVSNLYYNNKNKITFKTYTDVVLLPKYVKDGNKISKPKNIDKDGYVFLGWYNGEELYDFDEPINSNLELKAKWVKEEYITITFDTDSDYKINPKKVLKGASLKELEEPNKKYYTFLGWYLDNKLYEGSELVKDATLKAMYREIQYKVGDTVTIIGPYASSSDSINSYNKLAIGWKRRILKIYENSNYPFMVGNEKGVTGFFKKTSIERG